MTLFLCEAGSRSGGIKCSEGKGPDAWTWHRSVFCTEKKGFRQVRKYMSKYDACEAVRCSGRCVYLISPRRPLQVGRGRRTGRRSATSPSCWWPTPRQTWTTGSRPSGGSSGRRSAEVGELRRPRHADASVHAPGARLTSGGTGDN